jgi:hypothetical protein|tara:strand:+ start:1171 stop:1368 length:198 start_codon:yes stop_codon:yes gene_type:complete
MVCKASFCSHVEMANLPVVPSSYWGVAFTHIILLGLGKVMNHMKTIMQSAMCGRKEKEKQYASDG